ncbi:MAG: hypothetical protein JNL85_06655 [Rubrivivax sp.]|nr:hypothetical protein [Rubrivivax sp.]
MNAIDATDDIDTGTPAFFSRAPRIVVHDALAQLLGASADGRIAYRYADAVKLAGHSCPTVAGAWLMTRTALARLYPDEPARRGQVRVEVREAEDAGVAGVIASVATLVTGAAGRGGFKGLAGQHERCGLLSFGVALRGQLRFTRLDNGAQVEVSHDAQAVPRPGELRTLMQAALAPGSDGAARAAFAQVWQGWVGEMLTTHADDPALVIVHDAVRG